MNQQNFKVNIKVRESLLKDFLVAMLNKYIVIFTEPIIETNVLF